MSNTFCPYCQVIYEENWKHECTGTLKARIRELEGALLPFLDIEDKANYSIGEIKQSDIQYAKEIMGGNE